MPVDTTTGVAVSEWDSDKQCALARILPRLTVGADPTMWLVRCYYSDDNVEWLACPRNLARNSA
jgi:hypothetical protein